MGREDRSTTRRDAAIGIKAARKEKDRRDGSGFIALPHIVTDSAGYRLASHTARSLLVDLARAYTGRNNGSIWLSRSAREAIGWGSESTYRSALADLIACGLVVETRKGGRNLAAWFGLTWRDLDVTAGLDIDPRLWRRGAYLKPDKPPVGDGKSRTAKAAATRSIAASLRTCYKPAPSDGATAAPTAPSDGATDHAPCTVRRCSQADSSQSAAPSDGAYLEGCHLKAQRAAGDNSLSTDVSQPSNLPPQLTNEPTASTEAAKPEHPSQFSAVAFSQSLMATAARSKAMHQLGLDPVLTADVADPHPDAVQAAAGGSMLVRTELPQPANEPAKETAK